MKTNLFNIILNCLFILVILLITIVATTVSLTQKINQYRNQYNNGIVVTVVKQEIPIVSLTKGLVSKSYIKVGQEVKKGERLLTIDNPLLEGRAQVLESIEDNISAESEAKIARQLLEYNTVTSPVDGIIARVNVEEGSPVDELSQLMLIYANDNTKLLGYLTTDQYLAVQKMNEIPAYNARLNQNFSIKADLLKPDQTQPEEIKSTKKIALYFKLLDKMDTLSLLNNEDLELRVRREEEKITKPIDYLVDFWNNILSDKQ